MEAVIIIRVYGQPLNAMPGAPGRHEQTPRAAHYPLHLIAAVHHRCMKAEILGRVQSPVQHQRGQKNKRNWDESCK